MGRSPAVASRGAAAAPPGLTIVEMLVTLALSSIILGVLYQVWSSSVRQERNLARHLDYQRGLRGSMALVQHDLRELVEVIRLEREPDGTLIEFEFQKTENQAPETVLYRLERPPAAAGALMTPETAGLEPSSAAVEALSRVTLTRTFLDQERVLFEDSLVDFKIHPFRDGEPPEEVRSGDPVADILQFRVKIGFLPGKKEFRHVADQRSFSFVVHPRLLASRHKARAGRFGLKTGRFARDQRPPEDIPFPE